MLKSKNLNDLEQRLGYQFRDRELLHRALTHSSARVSNKVSWDNEQLEFLGDRVLGLIMAEDLVLRFPESAEGDLARRYNRLVNRETCARVGETLGLGQYIVLGLGEAGSGGRRKQTIIANACEALLAALFIDGGFEAVRNVTLKSWEKEFGSIDRVRADPKSALQEWAQGRGLSLPTYRDLERRGPDHEPRFTSEVIIDKEEPARGEGRNKRAAEQAAAQSFLERNGIWQSEPSDEC